MAKNQTSFKEGNQAAYKHGGGAAESALSTGKPFSGLAADIEKQTAADLEEKGPAEMLRREYVRVTTAAELYWQAIRAAADAGDLPRFESYVKKHGWLVGAASRILAQVVALSPKPGHITEAEILESMRGENEPEDN